MSIAKLVPAPIKAAIRKNPVLADKLKGIVLGFDLTVDSVLHRREIFLYNGIETMLSPGEREHLFTLARETNHGSSIVEIGCYAGGSAFFLGKGAERSSAHVYCVDPFASFMERQNAENGMHDSFQYKPSRDSVENALRKRGLDGTVTLIEGFSQDVARRWHNGRIGLLWVDGNHTQAALDFYAWKPHLMPYAIIAFHDVNTREEVAMDLAEIVKKERAKIVSVVDSITTIALKS